MGREPKSGDQDIQSMYHEAKTLEVEPLGKLDYVDKIKEAFSLMKNGFEYGDFQGEFNSFLRQSVIGWQGIGSTRKIRIYMNDKRMYVYIVRPAQR